MEWLALAAFAFAALHIFPATPLRAKVVARLGEQPYLGVFSLTSLSIFVAWVVAFEKVPRDTLLWYFPAWWPWLKAAILLPAFILFVASVSTPDPTTPQGAKRLSDSTSRGIFAITRHPGLWSFGLWGALHLISQPEMRGVLFFGVFALVAFGGMFLLDMRKAAAGGEAWERFAATTSRLPFLALAQGRAELHFRDIGWVRIGVGVLLWASEIYFHMTLFGASPGVI